MPFRRNPKNIDPTSVPFIVPGVLLPEHIDTVQHRVLSSDEKMGPQPDTEYIDIDRRKTAIYRSNFSKPVQIRLRCRAYGKGTYLRPSAGRYKKIVEAADGWGVVNTYVNFICAGRIIEVRV